MFLTGEVFHGPRGDEIDEIPDMMAELFQSTHT